MHLQKGADLPLLIFGLFKFIRITAEVNQGLAARYTIFILTLQFSFLQHSENTADTKQPFIKTTAFFITKRNDLNRHFRHDSLLG
ncbi:hypothetical protein D3C76_1499370 [compost metagenome]